jgi:hypothetical protein
MIVRRCVASHGGFGVFEDAVSKVTGRRSERSITSLAKAAGPQSVNEDARTVASCHRFVRACDSDSGWIAPPCWFLSTLVKPVMLQ